MGIGSSIKQFVGGIFSPNTGKRPSYIARYYSRIPGQGVVPLAPQAQMDYARLAGPPRDNGTVAICLQWLRKQVPQGRYLLGTIDDETQEHEPIKGNHPFYQIRKRPNPTWSWQATLGAITDCLSVDGNAYLLKARGLDGQGQPEELYWVPNEFIQIEPDPTANAARPIKCYWFRNYGATFEPWRPEDVIHFRTGIDPMFPWMGISALKRQLRSIAGLNAGESYTASVLRHGHAGKALAPKEGRAELSGPTEVELRAERDRLQRQSTGENAGRIAMATLAVELLELGMGPESMLIDRILDRPEAMTVAAFGLNTLVLDLPSSAATRTYANKAEARRDAWETGVIPLQDTICADLTNQLVYYTDENGEQQSEWNDPEGLELWVDRKNVAALREDSGERATRSGNLFTTTLMTRNEARSEGGYPPCEDEEQGEAYYGDPSPAALEQQQEIAAQTTGQGQGDAENAEEANTEAENAAEDDTEGQNEPVKAENGRWITTKEGHHVYLSGHEHQIPHEHYGYKKGDIPDSEGFDWHIFQVGSKGDTSSRGHIESFDSEAGARRGTKLYTREAVRSMKEQLVENPDDYPNHSKRLRSVKAFDPDQPRDDDGKWSTSLVGPVDTTTEAGWHTLSEKRAGNGAERIVKAMKRKDPLDMASAINGALTDHAEHVRAANLARADKMSPEEVAGLEARAQAKFGPDASWEDHVDDQSYAHAMHALGHATHLAHPELTESGKLGRLMRQHLGNHQADLGDEDIERFLRAAHDPAHHLENRP